MESSQRPFLCLAIATMLLQLSSSTEQLECCSEGEIQLVGGLNKYEGRVELCDGGEWKTVCDRMWREEEAKVVCRQLNYSNPSNATYVRRGCAGQGPEDQDTLKVEWRCSGEESKLLDCNRVNTTSPCDHRRDAGVYCSGQTPDNCEEDAIRLMDGPNNASGRVEVCQFGCWGTVCDEGWDRVDANTACRQLGFDSDQAIPVRGGYFGNANTSRQIHISQTECGMDDDVLANCGISPFMLNNCTHSQDAGVFCYESGTSVCKDGEIRLCDEENIYQSEGRVEMCLNGVWWTVCADGWDEVATNVVCTQLGYSTGNHSISPGNYPPLFNNIICSKNYSMLLQCIDVHNFGINDDCENGTAEVICEMPNASSENTESVSSSMSTSQTINLVSSTTSNLEPSSCDQSAIPGVVGGLLAIGVIVAVSVASVTVVIVVVKRKRGRTKLNFEKGSDSGMDNPTYNDCQGTQILNNMTVNRDSLEREFHNPIYSDEIIENDHHDIDSASKTTSQQSENIPHYEGVYFEGTAAVTVNSNEALHIYESADLDNGEIEGADINEIAGTGTDNGIEANDGEIMKGATSGEGEYELPPNLDLDHAAGGGDEGCYSTLNPTYSQLQPHTEVSKPALEVQIPQNDDEYSHLKY